MPPALITTSVRIVAPVRDDLVHAAVLEGDRLDAGALLDLGAQQAGAVGQRHVSWLGSR